MAKKAPAKEAVKEEKGSKGSKGKNQKGKELPPFLMKGGKGKGKSGCK
jgi:hypothetical protein